MKATAKPVTAGKRVGPSAWRALKTLGDRDAHKALFAAKTAGLKTLAVGRTS